MHLLLLLGLPVLPPLACLLNLGPAGVGLVSQHLGPGLLCLLLVDVLHQDTFVLEGVTLCLQVQLVVQVAINLLSLPVSLKKPPEHTHSHDPHGLLGGSAILDQLADVLARVGVGNLVNLVGIQPNLVLATFHDASGKALLQPQGTHRGNRRLLSCRSESSNKSLVVEEQGVVEEGRALDPATTTRYHRGT